MGVWFFGGRHEFFWDFAKYPSSSLISYGKNERVVAARYRGGCFGYEKWPHFSSDPKREVESSRRFISWVGWLDAGAPRVTGDPSTSLTPRFGAVRSTVCTNALCSSPSDTENHLVGRASSWPRQCQWPEYDPWPGSLCTSTSASSTHFCPLVCSFLLSLLPLTRLLVASPTLRPSRGRGLFSRVFYSTLFHSFLFSTLFYSFLFSF